MAKRAPSGAGRVFHRVALIAREEGEKAAARMMGVSVRRIRMIERADEKGVYKGIVTTQRGLSRWDERRQEAQVKVEARQSAREIQREATRNEIAQAVPGREAEISKALNRATRGRAKAEDLQLIRQAEQRIAARKEAERVVRPRVAVEEVPEEERTDRQRAEEQGWLFFNSPEDVLAARSDSIVASRTFANIDDALEKLSSIPKTPDPKTSYFAIVRVQRGEKFDYVLYDIRTVAEREKHAKGKPSKG